MKMTYQRSDEIAKVIKATLDAVLTEEEKTDFVKKVVDIATDVLVTTIKRAQIVEQSSERPLDTVKWGDVKDFICANAEKTVRGYSHPNRSTRTTNAIMREFHNLIGVFN